VHSKANEMACLV